MPTAPASSAEQLPARTAAVWVALDPVVGAGTPLRVLDVDGGLWMAWPKKASGVPTDLTEDVQREIWLPLGLVDNKVCAINEVWSGLRFVWRKELRASRR